MKQLFQAETWIAWICATAVAAFTMVSYAYSVFETKETAAIRIEITDKVMNSVDKRLERIENKIDSLGK